MTKKLIFDLPFWYPTIQLWAIIMGQRHSPDVNHCVLLYLAKGPSESHDKVWFLSPAKLIAGFEKQMLQLTHNA